MMFNIKFVCIGNYMKISFQFQPVSYPPVSLAPVSHPPVSHPQPDAPITANVQLLHQTAKKANSNNQKGMYFSSHRSCILVYRMMEIIHLGFIGTILKIIFNKISKILLTSILCEIYSIWIKKINKHMIVFSIN